MPLPRQVFTGDVAVGEQVVLGRNATVVVENTVEIVAAEDVVHSWVDVDRSRALLVLVAAFAVLVVAVGAPRPRVYALSASTGSDLGGIVLCGLLVAGLGILHAVTITQVSSVREIESLAPRAGFAELFRSGMRVGRDHLAPRVCTIACAYAGAALPTVLLAIPVTPATAAASVVAGRTPGTPAVARA